MSWAQQLVTERVGREPDPGRQASGRRGNLAKGACRHPHVPNPFGLTATQLAAVVATITHGGVCKAGAEAIGLNEKTVSAHITRAKEKIHATVGFGVEHEATTFDVLVTVDRWMRANGVEYVVVRPT